mgnify:CR=1 FL=1
MPVGKSNVGDYIQTVLGSIARLNQNQQQVRQENTTVARPAVGPQTAGQGLMSGVLNSWRRQQEEARLADEAVREQALSFLEAIPDSEHNTPLKMKMMLQIMQAKPGDKKGLMSVFQPEPDLDYKAQILAKIQGMIPNQREQELLSHTPAQAFGDAWRGVDRSGLEGKADLSNQEGNYQDLGLVYGPDGKAYSRKVNKKTGKEEITPIGDLQGEKKVIAGIRANAQATVPDGYKKKQRFLALQILNKQYETKGIYFDSLEDPDIKDEELKTAMTQAGVKVAKEIEDKALAASKRPEQIDADIEAKRGGMPNRYVNPTTGLAPSQETARNDEKIKEGAQIQRDIESNYAQLAAQRTALAEIDKNPSRLSIPSVSKQRAAIAAKITELETYLKSRGNALKQTGLFSVETEEGTDIPRGASVLNGTTPGTSIPKPTGVKRKSSNPDIRWEDRLRSNMPNVLTGDGFSNFAPPKDLDLKGASFLKFGVVNGMDAYAIKNESIRDKDGRVINPQLDKVITMPGGRPGVIKYIGPKVSTVVPLRNQ